MLREKQILVNPHALWVTTGLRSLIHCGCFCSLRERRELFGYVDSCCTLPQDNGHAVWPREQWTDVVRQWDAVLTGTLRKQSNVHFHNRSEESEAPSAYKKNTLCFTNFLEKPFEMIYQSFQKTKYSCTQPWKNMGEKRIFFVRNCLT